MSKTFLVILSILLVFSVSSFASTFYAGAGADVTLFSTKTIDATPSLTVGFSGTTNTSGKFGFLIPDETFVNFNYTWYGQGEVETKVYEPELEGFWYLEYKEGSPFVPFFIISASGAVVTETTETAEDTEFDLGSRFGLGAKYKVSDDESTREWGILGKGTVAFDEGAAFQTALGIYFGF